MKKLLVMLLIATLALSATAFAATYTHDDDIRFNYDENAFEITFEDHTDDEDHVILGFKDIEWGNGYIRIDLTELNDGETFPTPEEAAEDMNTEVDQLDAWANFKNVLSASFDTNDTLESVFIAPVYDDDGEVDDVLTVTIGVTQLDDEETGMDRDDAISDIVNTLTVGN